MPTEPNTFINALTNWYLQNKRELPWRETRDPYKIWLSEIILQQTRVDQGLPYYTRFVESYPTVRDLAAGTQEEVLRLWQGLGYYSRARNLHQCAQYISNELGGKFPENYSELVKLKGVGPYTAAAIASIAFGESVPVIDGNVYRVLSRILGIDLNIALPGTRKVFLRNAEKLIKGQNPEIFNQALMEFGALSCLPKNPKCEHCVIQSNCSAFDRDLQHALPVNNKKIKIRSRYFNYVVFKIANEVLMCKRKSGDIWQGLYDFHNIEEKKLLSEEEMFLKLPVSLSENVVLISKSKDYRHILTHQRIHASFFIVELNGLSFVESIKKGFDLISVSSQGLEELPKPRLIERFLDEDKIYIT